MWTLKSDQDLLKAIAEGDKHAFHALYDRHKSEVLGLSVRMMKDRAKGEDVFQTTWYKVTRSAHNYSAQGSVRSWILTIARNECISELRKNKKWADESHLDEIPDENATADLSALYWESYRADLLKNAIEKLPDRQRVALLLFYFQNQSMQDIAESLSLQINAVKALLFRARSSLKFILEENLK